MDITGMVNDSVTFSVDGTSIQVEPVWNSASEERVLRVTFFDHGENVGAVEFNGFVLKWDGEPMRQFPRIVRE